MKSYACALPSLYASNPYSDPLVHSATPWAAPTRPHAHAPEEQGGGGGCEDGVPGGMGL